METTAKPLPRILHLEDNQNDCLLVREMLTADDICCEMVAVETREAFESALSVGGYDLILSDYSLPSFDGMTALSIAQEMSPQVPFIFFSATIGEEAAVESLKNGATDYVLKQRPHRLVPAIRNALRNVQERSRLKSLENTLQQIEERFRIVARATNDVVWEWDIKVNRVWFSENFRAVFGHRPEEIGATLERWMDLIHPDDKARVIAGVTALLAGGGRVWWSEHRFRRGNGSYAFILDRASIIYDRGQPIRMVGVTIDLTERKHAEEKIREQAALLNHARDAIIVCDLANGRVLYWNAGASRIYGWDVAEAVGETVEKLLFAGNPPPELANVIHAVREHGEWIGELNETAKDGRSLIVQARASLIRDEKGQPKSSLIINTDLTDQKRLEEQLLRSQRLESLGVLVAGIAHDLNNALSPILIGINMLRERSPGSGMDNVLATMEGAAQRSADMLRQMLTFSRGGESSKTLVRPDFLLKEMARIINATFPKNIRCELHVAENSCAIHGFATQLHQVLMNLCVNARDAMPNGGTLALAAETVAVDTIEAALHEGVKPGTFLCLSVADTGTGIAEAQAGKIFEMFFTTKEQGKGTGLGLPTSLNIVKKHGGFITMQSRLGQGTQFQVFLPASGGTAMEIFEGQNSLPAGQGEHLLLVDDEESILAIMRTTLENYGYKVSTAASGSEAITLVTGGGGVDLVITDLTMPLMGGLEMLAAIQEICPRIKTIITSGARPPADWPQELQKMDAFLAKPVTTETLLRTVHRVLADKNKPFAAG